MQHQKKTKTKNNPKIQAASLKKKPEKQPMLLLWMLLLAGITFIVLSPMLNNSFTNWDDDLYVTSNLLLRGPDWKGIFTQPVVSNYHPLTILSLAFNWYLSKSSPSSYLTLNLLLHLANTALLFYLVWLISGKKKWVAFFTALVFAVHPMHVESVAWVAERKDVLYTFFFFLALIQYWKYVQTEKIIRYGYCMLFFILSLLSKPAAIVFPLVLFLLDFWKGRTLNKKVLIEKIPFLLLSLVAGIVLLKIQSVKAIAGLDMYPVWSRPMFACYVIMIYAFRFFIPFPLSAFHPYPSPDNLGWSVLISPLFIAALIFLTWHQRKNKWFVFGILFFVVNLLLVTQVISIGNTIVSERYTYVPYVGLAFLLGMWLQQSYDKTRNRLAYIIPAIGIAIFCMMTFERTKTWKNSETLWTDAINHYPKAPVPRTNRANYTARLIDDPAHASEAKALLESALADCNAALAAKSNHIAGYENRGIILLRLNRYEEAIADGDSLIKLAPENKTGYTVRGSAYFALQKPDKALDDLSASLRISPQDDFVLNMHGSILFNTYKKYREAADDFTKAIQVNPQGSYYLNRSRCFYNLGETANAKADAETAMQKGAQVAEDYRKLLNI